jgi:DNA-binding NarL/FixJ family response regulator
VIRVLLADDHQLVRAGLASLLEAQEDITVIGTAADGAEAVAMASRERPDVILMDLSMPGMGGEEATRRILADQPETAVVILTSFSDQERIHDALDAGAMGYLLKDAEPDELVRGIRAAHRGESPLDPKAASTLLTARSRPGIDLTDREQEVLRLVAAGLPNKLIAARLQISEKTVKAHLTSIFQSLDVTDRTQAALWAQRRGLVER